MPGKRFFTRLSAQFAAHWIGVLFWVMVSGVGLAAQQSGGQADILLHNGKILTVDSDFTIAEGIAIRGQRIAAVGSSQEILRMAGPGTKVFDLKGRTVIPGLINTHIHINDEAETDYGMEIGYEGFMAYPIDWNGVTTTQDVLNQVEGLLEKYTFQPGEWIYFASAGGSNDRSVKIMIDGLNRWELDKVTPDNPIVMGMTWPNVNGVVVNSKALDIIWAEHGDFFKTYGRYWVNEDGEPEGHLESPGLRFALEYLPTPPPEKMGPIFKLASEERVAQGVTSFSTRLPQYAIDAFQWLDARGEMPVRLAYGLEGYFGVTDLSKGLKDAAAKMGTGSDKFWVISAAPSAIDGSGSRACSGQTRVGAVSDVEAWFPSGQCLQDIEYRGAKGAPFRGNYFRDWFVVTARDQVRLANTHAAGDRAVKMALNLFEELAEQFGPAVVQGWAFDHCRMLDTADLPRAAKLGVMFSCSATLGSPGSEGSAYGEEVAHNFPSPLKSMFRAGVTVAVESAGGNTWQSIERIITRKDSSGKVWGAHERLSRAEALQTATRNAAIYILKEDQLGTLQAGKLADLVVLDKDYLTMPEDDIGEMQPQLTMMDGKIKYVHRQFAQEYSLSGNGMIVSTMQDLEARRNPSKISRR
ncbi:MAG: amidohydrolase family protein [Acidobacteria bacterium]|nr:amidohydrolase family protein [Acidobacteriota bacterium]